MNDGGEKYEKMKEVRDEVIALEGALADHRRENNYHAVLGEGSHDAAIVFVGEAPGKNEAEQGRPFCGAAGRLLDQLLEGIGTPRTDVYITNILKDRPPGNRDPLPSEIELYSPFLYRQIDIIRPKCIATLGRFSMEYIMRTFDLSFELEPISKAHGKVYETDAEWGKLKVIPQYHPAAAIYNQSLLETLHTDFQVLKST